MNKGLGALIVGIIAAVGGAIFATILIKNKIAKKKKEELDSDEFDSFDYNISDEELQHFFEEDNEELPENYDNSDIDISSDEDEDNDNEKKEQL